MSKKTPKLIQNALVKFEARQLHYAECLRIKRNVPTENQMPHIRDKSEEYFEGMAAGNMAATEDLLMNNDCYRGFGYINENGTPQGAKGNSPDWLVRFFASK